VPRQQIDPSIRLRVKVQSVHSLAASLGLELNFLVACLDTVLRTSV